MIYFTLHKEKLSDFNLSPYVEYNISQGSLCLTNNLFMSGIILKIPDITAQQQLIDILSTGCTETSITNQLKKSGITEPQQILRLLLQKGMIE